MRDLVFNQMVNSTFARVTPDYSNAQEIGNQTKKVYLRVTAVSCLERFESQDLGINWWENKDLMNIFKNMYKTGVLPLPIDAVERLRWIALLCIKACELEKFSYGNILNPLDYLPDEELDDRLGESVLTEVQNIRAKLRKEGWNAVFGW